MPDNAGRDPLEVAEILSDWLASQLPPHANPVVRDVHAPQSNGFSNETILCSAAWDIDGTRTERRLVVRVAPTRNLLFLEARFSTQYEVMKALSDAEAGVPLPGLGWYEEDPHRLGVPFFTMDHVEGLVPADNLPYTMQGWVIEASPTDQERMWWGGIEAMAKVHQVDWRRIHLELPMHPARARPGLDQQLAYYREFLDWSGGDRPIPVAEAAWKWLLAHRPEEPDEVVLCWGDARLGNMIWRDFTPVAVLDWEMATYGPAELDLGWWLYFDRQFTEGLGVPRPPGFPTREATIDRYATLIGRPLAHLDWYELFSGFRFAVIMGRLSDLLVGSGQLPEDSDMRTNNLATQFVAQLLGLSPPSA